MKKAQAAMEYLMVFGFGIAAVLIVVGTLAFFGVINPSKFMPERCVIGAGFRCVDFFIRGTTLMMKVENTLPKDLTIKRLELVSSSLAGGRCNSDASTLLKPLATTEIQIPGCAFTTTGKNVAKLNVLYTGGQITHSLGGDIILQVDNAFTGFSASLVGTTNTQNALAQTDMRKIARDAQGNIYVTYATGSPTKRINLAKSADDGKIFTIPNYFAIYDEAVDRSSIAVDSNDVVHVVYSYSDSATTERIRHRSSSDGYTAYHPISTEALNQKNPQISIGKDGTTLYVVWQGSTSGGVNYIRFAKSIDGGSTWNIKADVPNQGGALDDFPTLVEATDGTLYIVAISARNGLPINIHWTKSIDGGLNWDQLKEISHSTIQDSPSLVIDSSNNLHVIWKEGTWIKYSKYDGSGWSSTPDTIYTGTNPLSSSLTMDSADNQYAIWAEGINIYGSKKLWGTDQWSSLATWKATGAAAPKPSYRYSRYTPRGALDMVYMNTTTSIAFLTEPFG